ncbi:helix-turn-helix transcriptional regulator [Streptomyces sp. NBC_01477]|uniref:helix-turn-helix transcriptional regulator n=1 Tax=Streptomyces sp. NBC_01477 TaxID=2976015 RepID=UPI002E37A710|nr:helix-turn-helix transcriptional regulator [Streptomyces sp. NBC_01477]
MTSDNSQPPIGWRYCGSQCKLWRERAGVTRDALAKEANYEYETVKSMELGRRKPSQRLLEIADDMCGAKGMLLAAVPFLKPEPFPSYSQNFMQYEAEAVVRNSYEPLLVPGLLQTEETARALIGGSWPHLDDETVEERVSARMDRKELLDIQNKLLNFVVNEAALRIVLADRGTHKRQLLELLEQGRRRNVAIQVLRQRGPQAALNGPFVLLQMPDHENLTYEEGQSYGVLSGDAAKVTAVSQRYAMILRAALSTEDSAEFIRKLAEEL